MFQWFHVAPCTGWGGTQKHVDVARLSVEAGSTNSKATVRDDEDPKQGSVFLYRLCAAGNSSSAEKMKREPSINAGYQ